jgi:hypothetical protein
MTSNAQTGADSGEVTPDAGSSSDQHITGTAETGSFTTDETPTRTPAHGSGNAGVNKTGANRIDLPDEDAGRT